jgi:hypothetical protein
VTGPKLLLVTCLALTAPAAARAADEGKTWLLLVAVDKHDNPRLDRGVANTVRDADLLRKTLQERTGLPAAQILTLAGKAGRPTREHLRKQIPAFLALAGPNDRLIFFYSGHGVIHQDKAYLVPADLDTKNISGTGLPLAELRDALASCKAAAKFLVLDCCHAGGASRAPDDPGASSEAVAKSLQARKLKGAIVLGSCADDEESFEWPSRGQGIFTYWLCRGLEGGADENGDGKLTFEEIYQYVYDRVPKTAKEVARATQTPVRIVGPDVEGTPHLLALLPEPPESLCRRLAEQIDLEARRQKLKRVGVLEFTVPLAKVEGLARANLPAYCAEKVRAALAEFAGRDYELLTGEQMHKAAKGLRVEEVGDPNAMQRLRDAGGPDAVVTGTLKRRGANLHLQCDLVATATGNSLVKPAGVLPLSEELAADAGASFDNRERPAGSPYAPEVVAHVQQQAGQAHPLKASDFPFKVRVNTILAKPDDDVTPRTPRRAKDLIDLGPSGGTKGARSDLFIGARKDEMIEIVVENQGAERVALALLVDGVNTLGGKRQRLGEAWPWVLEPKKTYRYEGWYFPETAVAEPGQQKFKMNRFLFKDVAPAAGREKFGDAPGVITLAFYAERGRDLKLDLRQKDEQRTLQAVDFKAGRLLGVVQIRYADEDDLKKTE